MIDVETLRKLLRYDPETGKLYWLERDPKSFPSTRIANTWNSRFAGKEAVSSTNERGYKVGPVLGRMHKAHRVAWAIKTGAWPIADIDHINGDKADNRLANLREATRSENMRNINSHRDSTSKYLGVSWCSAERKWVAGISVDGKRRHIGRFKSERDAAEAFNDAAKNAAGEFAKLNQISPKGR